MNPREYYQDEVVRRARMLADQLKVVHDDNAYRGVWLCAEIHSGPYVGPTYTGELKALENAIMALDSTTPEKL
jgi:hypothetical protein